MSQHSPSDLAGLRAALDEVVPWLERARAVADAATNAEGGDPATHAEPRLLARHLGHYLAAAQVAEAGGGVDRLVDVGSGTGAFTGWLAERLGVVAEVVDHDPRVLESAAAVTGATALHTSLGAVPPAPLVTAMEVLEHIEPAEQPGFCAGLRGAVAEDGVLVLSTPDESLYPGGWSGYAPHVGCVTAGELATLLLEAGFGTVDVRRLTGGPYDTSPARRWGEAIGNRVWATVQSAAPAVAARLAGGSPDHEEAITVDADAVAVDAVVVQPAEQGRGGSLLAVARP